VNAALGWGGLTLGAAGSLGGVATLAYGLAKRRHHLLVLARNYAWLILLGAVVSFAAMERALITRDFSLQFVAEHGSTSTPALFNFASAWSRGRVKIDASFGDLLRLRKLF